MGKAHGRQARAEMRAVYGRLPGDARDQLRQQHAREARTPGTLAYHSRHGRAQPWLLLAGITLAAALIVLAIAAAGGDPASIARALFR